MTRDLCISKGGRFFSKICSKKFEDSIALNIEIRLYESTQSRIRKWEVLQHWERIQEETVWADSAISPKPLTLAAMEVYLTDAEATRTISRWILGAVGLQGETDGLHLGRNSISIQFRATVSKCYLRTRNGSQSIEGIFPIQAIRIIWNVKGT